MMTLGLMLTLAAGYSQNYWVVETDKKGTSVVKIYDAKNTLLSESKSSRRIDINKRKERKRLNRLLKQYDEPLWSKR